MTDAKGVSGAARKKKKGGMKEHERRREGELQKNDRSFSLDESFFELTVTWRFSKNRPRRLYSSGELQATPIRGTAATMNVRYATLYQRTVIC